MKGRELETVDDEWSPLVPERLLATVPLLNGRSAERNDAILASAGCRDADETESRSPFEAEAAVTDDRPSETSRLCVAGSGLLGSGEPTDALDTLPRASRGALLSEDAPSESTRLLRSR